MNTSEDSGKSRLNDWLEYEERLMRMYPHFLGNIARACPHISMSDVRLSAMLLLNISTNEIAAIIGISPPSVFTARSRLWPKFNLSGPEKLIPFLHTLAEIVPVQGGGRAEERIVTFPIATTGVKGTTIAPVGTLYSSSGVSLVSISSTS